MQVVLIILSLVLLGVIINYAVSSKSSRFLRLAALIALGLIALSLGVASIFLALNGSDHETEESQLPIFLNAPTETSDKGNLVEIVIFLVILFAIIVLIVVIASMDNKRRQAEAKKAGASPAFSLDGKHEDLGEKSEETPEKTKEDDIFSLE